MVLRLTCTAIAVTVAAVSSACGGGADAEIMAGGSNTLGPLMQVAAERFATETDIDVDVDVTRSGQGFEEFCADELDIANASREIDEDEQAACAEAGIEYVQFRVASDALTVAIHRPILYDWVTCLTLDQLRKIWEPDSTVSNWNEVDPSFPDVPLKLYGPEPGHGTFRFFTFVVNGERGASRTDYSATEDHDDTVEGIAKEQGALGYFGFSHYQRNRNRLSALEIDGGNGCVAPSARSVRDGSYQPLSRELYIYVNQASLNENRSVRAFVRFVLENSRKIAADELFIPLDEAEAEAQMRKFVEAIS